MPVETFDVFSGIGGFSLALRDVCKTVAYCERDAACQRILSQKMQAGLLESAPVLPDVLTASASDVPSSVRMVTAGFPCQDLSCANPGGLGLNGPRSGLVWKLVDLIAQLPQIHSVLLENSPVMLRQGSRLTEKLAALGFACKQVILSAEDVGAPHRRRRWWCLAVRGDAVAHLRSSAAPAEVDWSVEPCPRLLAKVGRDESRKRHAACCRLGNAVVPACARAAYNLLLAQHLGSLPLRVRPNPGTPLSLCLSDGSLVVHKSRWPTPNASHWYQYRVMTLRSIRMLSNAIFYEDATVKAFGGDRRLMDKVWNINPAFIEWMMGFPSGWVFQN